MSAPVILVAAPASGQGKTIVTAGLVRALYRRGYRVGTFKVGPDYIDPAFLSRAAARPALNLDSWAMRLETLVGLLHVAGRDADIVVGEGVMGLFDGALDGTGSTADLAALLGLPVLLVVDCGGMGASVAALVDGFRRHRDDVAIDGIILNRVASKSHADLLARALHDHVSTPVLGHLHRDADLGLPSRHLGLVQAVEHPHLEQTLDAAAARVGASVDLDLAVRLARPPSITMLGARVRPIPPLGQRIAVAEDPAFTFTYPSILAGWRHDGAELSRFSPLADEAPARDADAVFLPGGYPEIFAGELARATRFFDGLRSAAARGAFVYGECGGYMVLGRSMTIRDGTTVPMAGLLPTRTSFEEARLHLGYRAIETLVPSPLGAVGSRYRGHEFHYTQETERSGPPLFAARAADGRELAPQGCRVGSVAGSFMHLIDRMEPGGRRPAGALGKPPAAA